jgi:hypothetical protein
MRRWLLGALLACVVAGQAAAQDTSITTPSLYLDIDRNNAWANINKVYTFNPRNPDQSQCLYVHNQNPTSAHTITIAVFQTGDSQVTSYTGNTDRYIQVTLSGTTTPSAVTLTTGALATQSLYWRSVASARVAIQISGSTTQAGSPDNVDLFVVQTTQTNCGAGALSSTTFPDPCASPTLKKSVAINITTATTTTLVPLVSGQTIYPCTIVVDLGLNSSAVMSIQFEYGTGASCGTGTTALSGPMVAGASTGTGPVFFAAAGGITQFQIPVSNGFCVLSTLTGTPTAPFGAQGWATYVQQ